MEKDGNVYSYHLDRVGSPIMITNREGNNVRSNTYEAFGNIVDVVNRVKSSLKSVKGLG